MEYLWYTVAQGNRFHTDAELASPLWIFSLFRRHGTPATCKRRRGGGKKASGEAKRAGRGGGCKADKFFLTVHNDLYDPQINLAASHLAALARVGALVGLLYSTDLEVVVMKYLEPNWVGGEKTKQGTERSATWGRKSILASCLCLLLMRHLKQMLPMEWAGLAVSGQFRSNFMQWTVTQIKEQQLFWFSWCFLCKLWLYLASLTLNTTLLVMCLLLWLVIQGPT